MRFLVLAGCFAAFCSAHATTLTVAFGTSVPKDPTGQTLVESGGPSRASGGEHFILKMGPAKNITDIKLTAYSTSKTGKDLIHSVTAYNGSTATALVALSQFSAVTVGNPTNYQNLAMIADSQFVETNPNQAVTELDFVIEGFTNDDASLVLQVTSSDNIPSNDFLLTRTGPNSSDTLGTMIDETTYAAFSASTLNTLMTSGTQPAASDLAGKTFTCTSYTKLDATQVDVLTRTYAVSGTTLQSTSSLEGSLTWAVTADGLSASVANQNGCGSFGTVNVVRLTPGGNLISEVDLNLSAYLNLCVAAGYDLTGTQDVEQNSTFASVVNTNYVVDSYEFCH